MSLTPSTWSCTPFQEKIPDFFSDSYHQEAADALERVEGITLSNFLAGQVFHGMILDVFEEVPPSRSNSSVDDSRDYMQKLLETLSSRACAKYPGPLREMVNDIVRLFLEEKEKKARWATSDICRAEIGWMFTQSNQYVKILDAVTIATKNVYHKSAAAFHQAGEPTNQYRDVYGVPGKFIQEIVESIRSDASKRDVFELQVRNPFFQYSLAGRSSL